MTKIIDRTGKGADISAAENDANLSSLSGINAPITATTHTIDINDQNDTIEYSNASAIAVTLPAISTLTGANLHTDDFTVTFKNIGAGTVTVTCDGTETTDAGDATIVLLTGEAVKIQTDNSLTKWNLFPFGITGVTVTAAEINTLVGNTLKTKVIDIGDWNMDTTLSVNVAHGLSIANIRSVTAMIRDDTDTNHYPILHSATGAGTLDGTVNCNAVNALVKRLAGGFFDSTDYDSTSYNRGWVIIQYV